MKTVNNSENALTQEQTELISKLESGMKVSYLELKRNGIKVVNDPNNRNIYSTKSNDFLESVKKDGIQNPIQVITADDYIGRNGSIELGDVEYTAGCRETANVIVILDGGNRMAAYEKIRLEDPGFNKKFNVIYSDLADGVSCFKAQDILNNISRPWSPNDRMNFLEKQYKPEDDTILSFMNENSVKYRISLRSSYMMCTRNDKYKKEMLENSMRGDKIDDRIIGTKEEVENGKAILEAMLVAFRKERTLLKNMAIVRAVCDDLGKCDGRPDSKDEHMKRLLVAVKSLDAETLKVAKEKSSVPEKTQVFADYFNRFFKDINSNEDGLARYEEVVAKAEMELEDIRKKEKETKDKKANEQKEESLKKLKTRCVGKFSTLSEKDIQGGKADAINEFVEKHADDAEEFFDSLTKSEAKEILTVKKIKGVKNKEQYSRKLNQTYEKFISARIAA